MRVGLALGFLLVGLLVHELEGRIWGARRRGRVGLTTNMHGGLGKLATLDSTGQEGDTGTATSGGDKVTREV